MRKTTNPPNVGIGRLLREASMTFNRVFRMQLAAYDITYGQFQYLQSLWDADGLTQIELTRRVGIEIASSTAILDSLEERNFIKRVRNAMDRRKLHIHLTPLGADLKDDLMACAIATNSAARHGLSSADVVALFNLVGRIVKNLQSVVPAPAGVEASAERTKVSHRTRRQISEPTKVLRQPQF